MEHNHTNFYVDLMGRLGPLLVSATLAGCIITDSVIPVHILLMGTGVAFIALHHWFTFHGKQKS
jgi:hypothetical protein